MKGNLKQPGQSSSTVRRKLSDAKMLPKPVVKLVLVPQPHNAPLRSNTPMTPEAVLNFVGTGQARERATELFMNASSFLSGVLSGSGAPASSAPMTKKLSKP